MFCNNCGSEIRDDSNFCWKCGKPQKAGFEVDEPQWELCEIMYEPVGTGFFARFQNKFIAKAIGPKGAYIAGQTSPINEREEDKFVDALVKKLVSDNWEPTGRGEQYWNYKFRRRIK